MTEKRIIYYCLEKGYECFEDYIDSLGIVDEKIYYNYDRELYKINFDDLGCIHIFRYHLPGFLYGKTNIFVLNTEQLTEPSRYNHIMNYVKRGVPIIDYSLVNIRLMRGKGIIFYLPYQYSQNEIRRLQEFSKEYKYDIGIINCSSRRRKELLCKLKGIGLRVIDIRGWKDERDSMVGSCKILLNIHLIDDFSVYEHIRCDRWLFAGKLIISEPCSFSKDLDVVGNVVFSNDIENSVLDYIDKIPLVSVSNNVIYKRFGKLRLFLDYINNL